MKILFFHYATDFLGGSDRSLYELVSGLGDGCESSVVLKTHDPYIEKYGRAGINANSFPFYGPPGTLSMKRWVLFLVFFMPSLGFCLYSIVRYKPDVIHVNTMNNIHAGLAAFLMRKPLLWHVREHGKSVAFRVLLNLVYILADRVLCVSECVERNNREKLVLACLTRKSTLIYNAVSVGMERELSEVSEPYRIILPSRVEPWKGQLLAVNAFAKVINARKCNNVYMEIVGNPSSSRLSYYNDVLRQIEALGLSEFIRVSPHSENVYELISNSDLLIQCSIDPEPFGRTVVEAMVLGCSVVVANNGGGREIVEKCGGRLFEAGDESDLANVIMEFLDDSPVNELKQRLEAKDMAVEYFNLERLKAEFIFICSQVCGLRYS